MVNDAFGIRDGIEHEKNLEEAPNEEERCIYQQLEETSLPLYPHFTLFIAVRLISIKSDWHIAQSTMDSLVGFLGELVNPELNIP